MHYAQPYKITLINFLHWNEILNLYMGKLLSNNINPFNYN
jgi:hypothetical protein